MYNNKVTVLTFAVILLIVLEDQVSGMSSSEKQSLKLKVVEMFKHAYGSYMKHAYPADELMPLSCKGRFRGSEPSRGDVDDSLGNFTLTLVDTLDTLAIMGDIPEFERAVRNVIRDTKFDADVAVSVFETNIRVLGGLLGGHVIASYLRRRKYAMEWYSDELLAMAKDIGTRLLPAFNTTTGIPYPRVNLKLGIDPSLSHKHRDTCTACAGTMILEFAALSRLTGDPVFEDKAHKAMDYLWNQRHRSSDLMGTVINIQNGDWIRRESGVGAGIDSYYEYVLKAYILLGDDTYLERFNKVWKIKPQHYDAIMKYVSQGPLFVDVHMHRPHTTSRHFMDALLAFWPGLQVLKGDIQPAIELHEMLYQVMQRHKFLPEAFTSDFRVHWGQHPLRPEFVESTYFLYKATGDPYYLEVGKVVIDNLEKHARVPCGFAALKDVTKGTHEDQLDSFVLAETFKYLFLLYAEKSDMLLDVDDYIFTTEAHLLPLTLSLCNSSRGLPKRLSREMYSHLEEMDESERNFEDDERNTCPNPLYKFKQSINYAQNLRSSMKDFVKSSYPENGGPELPLCPSGTGTSHSRLRAQDFVAGNKQQLIQLKNMGIQLVTMKDGRIQLLHTATEALSSELAEDGLRFMQEMIELSKTQQQSAQHEPMLVQLLSPPYLGSVVYKAGPAQFGYDLKQKPAITGLLQILDPFKGCTSITNGDRIRGKIAILERGDCMFIDKARNLEQAGAIGGIVIDHNSGTSTDTHPLFAMSGDNNDDVHIPLVFLFHKEGQALIEAWEEHAGLQVMLTDKIMVFGSETTSDKDSSSDAAGTSQSETEKESHDQDSIQRDQTPESEEEIDKPYIERTFQFQPLQPVGENNLYTMTTGTHELKMHIIIDSEQAKYQTSVLTDDGIISLITLPDDTKQLIFNLDRIKTETGAAPGITEIYEEVSKTLQAKTNFEQLKYKTRYLSAILALLEAAYYGVRYENEHVKTLFNDMANELEIIPEKSVGDSTVEKLERVVEEAEEQVHSTDQSEEVLHSADHPEVQYYYPEIPKVQVIESGGMKVKITTRTVPDGSESYADEKDFEEAVNQFKSEYRTGESNKDTSDIPEDKISGSAETSQEKEPSVGDDRFSKESVKTGTDSLESDVTGKIGDAILDNSYINDLNIQSIESESDSLKKQTDSDGESLTQEHFAENSIPESDSQGKKLEHSGKTDRRHSHRGHGDL